MAARKSKSRVETVRDDVVELLRGVIADLQRLREGHDFEDRFWLIRKAIWKTGDHLEMINPYRPKTPDPAEDFPLLEHRPRLAIEHKPV